MKSHSEGHSKEGELSRDSPNSGRLGVSIYGMNMNLSTKVLRIGSWAS